MPKYLITKHGPSHYGRSQDGKTVRYNANPNLGRNVIELERSQADSGKYSHLGLQPLEMNSLIIPPGLNVNEPPKQEQKKLKTNPKQGETETNKDEASGSAKPTPAPKVEIPKDWDKLPKARRAAIVRRITGKSATSWGDNELNAAIQAYIDGNDSDNSGS